ncbi:carbohydrate kinase [Marivita sp. S0852]|uniref:carbohydrate kinase family protein n=1 Tax=Marivita sp. S0852 TaxID=3373893 RepID=UPI003981E984
MAHTSIIGVGGENLIDHVTQDGTISALAGGSPFNVAMALGRQTAAVHYLTPISTDHWGNLLADTLHSSHVVLSGGRVDAPTTIARVTVTDGIPTYTFERDGTAERQVTPASLAQAMPEGLAALHTGSLALTDGADADAWEATCDAAFRAGRLVSLDPNVRLSVITDPDQYRSRMFRMMAKTSLLKLSDEDLEGLCPDQSLDQALQIVRSKTSAPLLVMTKGPDGAIAVFEDRQISIPAPPVPGLVDTVGAGDTFMATLLAGLDRISALSPDAVSKLSGSDIESLLHRAGMAAAINCSRAGCNPPTLKELDTALAHAD